ncbi:unnamed protein product [Mytilus coruscus]|uniref:Uncharacterized protein n=1 Tax=Mytilus coruscus TaxID=42192 RepID=A0A6J8F2A0_MYTCO|nr:unnamed protein product [Mytilus coruscus]
MLYVEIGLTHTEIMPKKKLVVPPRYLPDISKMSARYAGFETVSQFEIKELCERLSKPKRKNTDADHKLANHSALENVKTHHNKIKTIRFTGKKKISTQDMQSLVDRLSNTKSAGVPDSQRYHSKEDKHVRGVVASHAWNGHIKHYSNCSHEHFEKYVHKVRNAF